MQVNDIIVEVSVVIVEVSDVIVDVSDVIVEVSDFIVEGVNVELQVNDVIGRVRERGLVMS